MKKALRIILTQNKANYKREECTTNKMTYPLPPFSTIIGAIHSCCDYKKYHDMDISIQGDYETVQREMFHANIFLDSLENDRGILVKLKNPTSLSSNCNKVAQALKKQGSNFKEKIDIKIFNKELLKEYIYLKNSKDILNENKKKEKDILEEEKKKLEIELKKINKDNENFEIINNKLKEIKNKIKTLDEFYKKEILEKYEIPISFFKTLVVIPSYYEVLTNIKLIIHVQSDDYTLNDIKNNIYNLKNIGRSEDFVDVKEVKLVELHDKWDEDKFEKLNNYDDDSIGSNYSMFLDFDLIKDNIVKLLKLQGKFYNGTKYYINKNYSVLENKRIFNKSKVLYTSKFFVSEKSFKNLNNKKIYIDIVDNEACLVSFL